MACQSENMDQPVRNAMAWLALSAVMLSQAVAPQNPHTQGYPPLAVAYVTIQSDQLTCLKAALQKFAQLERLEFKEGSFEKQGRPVQTFYMTQDNDAPVYSISNFMESNRYRAIAYAGNNERSWQARWLRLLSTLRKELGAGSVSARNIVRRERDVVQLTR